MSDLQLTKTEAKILTDAAASAGKLALSERLTPASRARTIGRFLRDGLIAGEPGSEDHVLTRAGYRAVGLEPPRVTRAGTKQALVLELLGEERARAWASSSPRPAGCRTRLGRPCPASARPASNSAKASARTAPPRTGLPRRPNRHDGGPDRDGGRALARPLARGAPGTLACRNRASRAERRVGSAAAAGARLRVQANAFGDLSPETARLLSQVATGRAVPPPERRESPGTVLVREWNGVRHHVMVLKDGFGWNGESFRSLSEVAGAITGTKWSGPRFFGLKGRVR